jgi:uncharacterized damage-inducible protein DinB
MTAGATLLLEFDREMAKTRRILECVPDERFAWTPHEKSSSLGKLANHLAALPIFAAAVINGQAKKMHDAASNPELLEALDKNMAAGREALAGASDDHLAATVPALRMTRADLLRDRMISHMIHHRGQLTVYLRLLGVAVPGMYGPSADDKL